MLNYHDLVSGFTSINVGRFTSEYMGLVGVTRPECNIVLWEDRFFYIQKHITDFERADDFIRSVECIPEIIASPDYIGMHPTKNSIEYIKRFDKIMLAAVRFKPAGNLAVRSLFPITEDRFNDYLSSGTIVKVP